MNGSGVIEVSPSASIEFYSDYNVSSIFSLSPPFSASNFTDLPLPLNITGVQRNIAGYDNSVILRIQGSAFFQYGTLLIFSNDAASCFTFFCFSRPI